MGRHLQELRRPVPCCIHGRQRRGDAWQGHFLRAQGGGWCRWQEEVSSLSPFGKHLFSVAHSTDLAKPSFRSARRKSLLADVSSRKSQQASLRPELRLLCSF